jgi:nitrate reductase assembly molybdenum cofactor insertion protein NarJ
MTIQDADTTTVEFSARRVIAASLSLALAESLHGEELGTMAWTDEHARCVEHAWLLLCEQYTAAPPPELGLGELPPEATQILPLTDWFALSSVDRDRAMQDVFGLIVSPQCPQYETEYCHWKDPTYRAQQMADIAGFYRAFGLETSADRPERPDHIALELEFLAFLLEKRCATAEPEQIEVCDDARAKFVQDHLVWWAPTFARLTECRIVELCGEDSESDMRHLRGIGELLRAYLTIERWLNALDTPKTLAEPSPSPPSEEEDSCGQACRVGAPVPVR